MTSFDPRVVGPTSDETRTLTVDRTEGGARRSKSGGSGGRRLGTRSMFVPVAIGTFSVYSATSVLALPYERTLFGLIFAVALIVASTADWHRLPRGTSLLSAAWISASAFYFMASLFQPVWVTTYVLGDLLLSLLPLLMLVAFLADESSLRSHLPIRFLVIVLTVAAFEAQLVGILGNRHDPPSPLIIAAGWYYVLAAQRRQVRTWGALLVLSTGYLSYSSGYRTHMLLWLAAPILISFGLRRWKALISIIAVVACALLMWSLSGHSLGTTTGIRDARFQAIVNDQPDISLQNRVLEARSVLWTASNEWLPGEQVIGFGFGATYEPHFLVIVRNVGANGRAHSIHIGPVLVYFRFGLLGLAAMGWFCIFCLRRLLEIGSSAPSNAGVEVFAILTVSTILFLLEFLTLDSTVDPTMSYCVAGVLATWLIRKATPSQRSDR